jgi:glycosyltransferase involved in cell wall biosynthesis
VGSKIAAPPRLRVLLAPEWYPWEDRPYFGQFCREQARTVAREHDVVVLTWRVDPKLRRPFRVDERFEDGLRTFRVRFRHVAIPKADGASKLAGCLSVLARLRLSGWAPDLIHAHEYEAGRTALMLGRLSRAPVVVSEHYSGFALGGISRRDLARAASVFRRAAVVSPVSRDLERRLRQLEPAAHFETVPNVVDTRIFHPADGRTPGHDGRRLRLVAVGSLVEVKGHRYLLEALALVARDRDVELHLVGDGPLKEELSSLARSLGLGDRVAFLGALRPDDVAAELQEADIFVLPSLWENLPCALVEAKACGLPSVATHVGDVPEVVDGDEGVIVACGSADALAGGIVKVASRLDRYDRQTIAARAAAAYGFAPVGRRWSQVYSRASAASA